MPTTIRLTQMLEETNFAPLGVLGYCLTRTNFFAPAWAELALSLKTVDHAPTAKLLDIVVSILAGCRAISQVNTRLCPDVALAQAWGRARFAEQSQLARTLDAFSPVQVGQLRRGCEALWRRESYIFDHDFERDWLYLDIDLTPLPISKRAEASTKGKFAKKTATDANSPVCRHPSITKRCFPGFIPVSRTAAQLISRSWRHWTLV